MPKRSDYLYQRAGSRNWYVKLQYPSYVPQGVRRDGKAVWRKSLDTVDYDVAKRAAAPYVLEFLERKLAFKSLADRTQSHGEIRERWRFPVGQSLLEDGTSAQVSEAQPDKVVFTDALGRLLKIEDNVKLARPVIKATPSEYREIMEYRALAKGENPGAASAQPDEAVMVDEDHLLIEAYITHKALDERTAKEVRDTLAIFKRITNGKRFEDCDRTDGKKLYEWFRQNGGSKRGKTGNNLQTCQKKVGWLRAAVNQAFADGKLKIANPFSGVVPANVRDASGRKTDEALDRLILTPEDVALMYERMHELSANDQMTLLWCEKTGMRLSEVYQIEEEFAERVKGKPPIRFVIVGRKNEESERRVPIPDSLLPHLPEKITGPLISNDRSDYQLKLASKRLNHWMRRIGIKDKRKVFHSLRHRAQDRLRVARVPDDQRWAILGHEQKTVASGYGEGFPMWMLKPEVELIGWHPSEMIEDEPEEQPAA